jgi:PAS domain S-box-containing protein
MRLRTQFIITMFLFGIILVVIATSAIITNQHIEKASKQEEIASSIAQGANELSYLSNDYLIYRESQQLSRWQSRFASFSSQVASLRADRPEQQALVVNIRANQERLKEVFESVASAPAGPSRNQKIGPDPAYLQVSWSRMAVQSQGLISDASRLSQLLHQQMDRLTSIRTMLIYIMVGLFGAFLLASYMLTYRNILKSIVTLHARTAVIGSGNFDFIIEEKRNDEIGDLSLAFDQMTTNLKAVTASKADLEREVTQRKQAEEDLRRQREWLRVTLTSIGDAVIACDIEGQITFLNPVAVTLTGWQTEKALGQPIRSVFRIINEKTRIPAEDLVARVLNEKRVVGLANDTALVTKDGREVPIEDSAAPILDADGNVTGVVLVFHDVTEKRHAQAALREAHERAVWLARLPEQNPNPVIRASADGTILYCNPSSAKFPGWKCKVGQLLQNELLPLFSQAMVEGKELQRDEQIEERFYFIWITPFLEEGYANIYGRDITERKKAEEALRRAKEEWEQTFNTVPDLMSILDNQHRIVRVNKAMADRLGLTPEQCIGLKCHEAVHGLSEPTAFCPHALTCQDGQQHVAEVHETRLGGDFLVSTTPLCNPQGKLIGAVHVARDITRRKQMEEALRSRTVELERLTETLEQQVQERTVELARTNEALRHLSSRLLSAQEDERKRVAGEIHDTLGACLSGIKFKVEKAMQDVGKAPNAATESLNAIIPMIQEGVEECRRIQMDLRPSMLDDLGLLPTLSWFCRRFQTIYTGIKVELEKTLEEHEIPDSLKVVTFRVTQEAMNNIAKHSKGDLIRLSLQKIEGRMELLVGDNGRGFDLEKVLGSESTRRGLGLTSMRERTELSGGAFSIESSKGKGTVIHASWPLHEDG